MLFNVLRRAVCAVAICLPLAAASGSYEDFFIAVKNDFAPKVAALLERGFDPNSRDPNGQTGLTIAMQERSLKTARVLLAHPGIEVNLLNASGESPLMMAALKGDLDGMRAVLERGARIDLPGWSPLHYAATGPESDAVSLLLARGASIDARSPNGTTPLMMAAQYGTENSVELLLRRGANPALRNDADQGVIDFAKRSGREPLIKRLQALPRQSTGA